MNNFEKHARAEFQAVGWMDENGKFKDEMQALICADILDLLNLFSKQGHSGMSANLVVNLFTKLAKYGTLYCLSPDFSGNKYVRKLPIKSWEDTCSYIEAMDLIISIDTSLIHLAGAIGKKSFLLLPWVCEWRWLVDQEDSPWYESIKIIRQKSLGDWSYVINKVENEISSLSL